MQQNQLGGKSQSSKTTQTAQNSQVGVQGGVGVGSGNSGVAGNSGNSVLVNDTAKVAAGGVSNINVTTADASNDAAAFSTIDHLIAMESQAPIPQSVNDTASSPAPASPVIISTGNDSGGGSGSSGSGVNWVNWAVIGGGVLTLIVFLRSKGKSA